MLAGEAPRDVDPLLFAAGKGRWRQRPEALGQVQAGQQRRRALTRGIRLEARVTRRRGDDVERGDARNDAQELADIAHDPPPRVDHLAWASLCNVEKATAGGEQDAPAVRAVIAVGHFQDRGLADTGWSAKHHAFAALHRECDPSDDRQPGAAMQMQGEGLVEALDDEELVWRRGHAARTEDTRSCV
jgi:hypothetical protein